MARDNRSSYLRRTERARAEGWTGYPQKRYWMPRFQADQQGTAEYLAARVCNGENEHARQGSYMCRKCNTLVNPPGGGRQGDWRARLVNVAASPQLADRSR